MDAERARADELARARIADLASRAFACVVAAKKLCEVVESLGIYNDDGWAGGYQTGVLRQVQQLLNQQQAFIEAVQDATQPDVPF